jgi:xylan 1,4-beta-xylosidase
MIQNPILTGFNPDPSAVVVGSDFYIATSTFEWFPGVQIHHSRDLVHWRLLGRAMDRVSQLDLRGLPHSCGVWAPCLSHADGLFWLVFANVQSFGGAVTDSPVFVATAEAAEGPWSDTTRLCADGFDPSLFHDDDGRKYLVNMTMGEPGSEHRFNGITLQEFDPDARQLTGPRRTIWPGTRNCTEGPHLYRKDGWYYLLAAEGGTGQNHCISMARSRELWGPYENAPNNPILTSRDDPDNPLQAAGHGDLFQTPDGGWWTTHLCKRQQPRADGEGPVALLGRETAIQPIDWPENDWPRLRHGGHHPQLQIPAPDLPSHPWPEPTGPHSFATGTVPPEMQTLREPPDESWLRFDLKPGCLSLKGRQSLFSCYEQSLVARRLTHHAGQVSTSLLFNPQRPKQQAGLILYYDRINYHYLRLSRHENGRLRISVVSADDQRRNEGLTFTEIAAIDAGADLPIGLRMQFDGRIARCAYRLGSGDWQEAATSLDMTTLGDGASTISGFTGTFAGICAQDMTGDSVWAHFREFNMTTDTPFNTGAT